MNIVIRPFIFVALWAPLLSANAANTVTQTATALEASQTVTLVPISLDDLFFVIPVGTGVPPDPGENGKFTIQGVDADGDGIRDDVEQKISLQYPDNGMARAYSYMVAMTIQNMIENSTDQQIQIQSASELYQLNDCLDGLLPSDAKHGTDLVLPWVLNTYQRSYAYIDARGLMGGRLSLVATKCQ